MYILPASQSPIIGAGFPRPRTTLLGHKHYSREFAKGGIVKGGLAIIT